MVKNDWLKDFLTRIKNGATNVKNWSQGHLDNWNDFFGDIHSAWDTLTGKNEEIHATKADELAAQSQKFNEQYSRESLAEQARQFEITNETANRNIDFQKQIAEQNLAFQQDAFNRQLQENELTRQREDTAYQRQVADLKAAGLSPLMASNGANAASMSVGSAPQYDAQAVSSAQGSAIQLAQEYAQLMNMAKGQYLSRKQEAANQQIAAKLALSSLFQQRRVNGQNLALQSFNLATDLRDMKKKHQLIDEQIASSKAQRNWMSEHGYRNQDAWSIILPVLNKLSDKLNINSDTIAEALSNGFNRISSDFKDLVKGKPDRSVLSSESQRLVKSFSDDELQELTVLASLNIKLKGNDADQVTNLIYEHLDHNEFKASKLQIKKLIEVNGLKYVLNTYFKMGL